MPSVLFASNLLRYNVWHWFMTYLFFFIILDYLFCKRFNNDYLLNKTNIKIK